MKKHVSFFVRLLIGIVILILLVQRVKIGEILGIIKQVDFLFLVLLLIVYPFIFIMGSINLKLLLDQLRKLSKWDIFKYYLLSWSLGLCVPGKVGEFSLIYFLKKHKITIGEGMVVAILDKLITIVVFLLVSLFGFFLFFEYNIALRLTLLSILGFVVVLIAIFSSFGRELIKRLILRKYAKIFKGFSKNLFYYFKKKKKVLSVNLLITFIKLIVSSLPVYILFQALGSNVGIVDILLITAIVTIISLIPISISGLGVREVSAVYLYSLLGVGAEITAALYMILLVINYLIALLSISLIKH